jgi:hypothetical protein
MGVATLSGWRVTRGRTIARSGKPRASAAGAQRSMNTSAFSRSRCPALLTHGRSFGIRSSVSRLTFVVLYKV